MKPISVLIAIVIMLGSAGCKQDTQTSKLPQPSPMTEEATGYYCSMNILEHKGPKAQMYLEGLDHPIWFSQIRDAIAYMRSPEETRKAVVTYVTDMGKAGDWDYPGDDTWIKIDDAYFVTGSQKVGGMGAPEAVPFGTQDQAKKFTVINGGAVSKLAGISDAYVLGPVDLKFPTLKTNEAAQ